MVDFYLLKRRFKFLCQRIFRGWDDSETWDLDTSFAKFALPRLKRFKELEQGHPSTLTEDEWNEYLDAMIWSFKFTLTTDYYFPSEEQLDKFEIGINLFAKYYRNLWW